MNAFYKQYRGRLQIYCVSARIIGWMLMIVPAMIFTTRFLGKIPYGSCRVIYNIVFSRLFIRLFMLRVVFPFSSFMLLGLALVGVAQFIRYLYDDAYQAGWSLRHGSAILYTCAVITPLVYIGGLLLRIDYITGMDAADLSSDPLLSALLSLGIVLILVGTGQVLRRIMPVIEDSKTLVKSGTTTY
jgi:hypothetical protein